MKQRMSSHIILLCIASLLAACSGSSSDSTKPAQASMMQMAAGFKQSGHLEQAATVYARVAEDEKTLEAYLELIKILRKMGNNNDALVAAKQAYDEFPREPELLKEYGYTHIALGQGKEAKVIFDKWAEREPNSYAAVSAIGVALDTMGEHKNAQDMYKKALAMAPTNAKIVGNNLAMSYILTQQWDEAIKLLEPLVKEGGSATTRQNLALAYAMKGNTQKAYQLNLKDLPEAKAKENMRFYESYKKRLKAGEKPPTKPTE